MNLLFVCRHGAAKSVLAAELARGMAADIGLPMDVEARGLEPEPELSPALGRLPGMAALRDRRPIGLTAADLDEADLVVTFDLAPGELPSQANPLRWDGLPAVGDDPIAARHAIADRVRKLIADLAAD